MTYMDMDRKILQALQTKTLAAIVGTNVPESNVKVHGRVYEPVADKAWLEIVYIPNNLANEFWDSGKTYQGLFRLILHYPINDEGIYPAMNEAVLIGDKFTKGTPMVQDDALVRITDHPDMASVMEMPDEILCVIAMRYSCFKA